MKYVLKIEEFFMFFLGGYLFTFTPYSWWYFPLLILIPDLSMVGYFFNNKTGAILYNIFHHKGIAISLYFLGIYWELPLLVLLGIILFSHSSMDRFFGYGLKFEKGFIYTHLGKIGKGT